MLFYTSIALALSPCVWELLLEMLLWAGQGGNTLGEHKWPHTSWPEGPSRPPEVVSKRCLEKKYKARASPPPYLLNSLQHWASQARGCIFSLSSPSWYLLHEFVCSFFQPVCTSISTEERGVHSQWVPSRAQSNFIAVQKPLVSLK